MIDVPKAFPIDEKCRVCFGPRSALHTEGVEAAEVVRVGLLSKLHGDVDVATWGEGVGLARAARLLAGGCSRPMMTVSAVAGWTVVPRVVPKVPVIDPLPSGVPLVPP
jgi:hypothetical protein